MEYKIQKNMEIPIPRKDRHEKKTKRVQTLSKMSVGDSFLVDSKKEVCGFAYAASLVGCKTIFRTVIVEGHKAWRIWRVK